MSMNFQHQLAVDTNSRKRLKVFTQCLRRGIADSAARNLPPRGDPHSEMQFLAVPLTWPLCSCTVKQLHHKAMLRPYELLLHPRP